MSQNIGGRRSGSRIGPDRDWSSWKSPSCRNLLLSESPGRHSSDEHKHCFAEPKTCTRKPSVQLGQEYRAPLTANSCSYNQQL